MVGLLLERNVDPNASDDDGWTPLITAVQNGYQEAVRLLLGRQDLNPDIKDNRGETPLMIAVENGHEEIVRLLLGKENDAGCDATFSLRLDFYRYFRNDCIN